MNDSQRETEGFRLSLQQADVLDAERRWGRELRVIGTWRFDVRVEPARLRAALDRLSERHEILRTLYREVPGLSQPLQVVQRGSAYRLRELEDSDRGGAPDAPDARPDVDAGRGPVLDVCIRHLDAGSVVSVAAPSSSLDESSMQALLEQLALSYDGQDAVDGLQYVDYSEWQHELCAGDWGRQAERFWTTAVHPEALLARLPFEREGRGSGQPSAVEVPIARLDAALAAMAQALGTSKRELLFFLWTAFAARLSGANDGVSCFAADKANPELAATLGRFAQNIPVSCALDPAASVRQNFTTGQARLEECLAWREAFRQSELWSRLAPDGAPVFPFGFCSRELGGGAGDRARARVSSDPAELERLRLELCSNEAGEAGTLRLIYRESSFARRTVEVWAEQFATFVADAASGLDRSLSSVSMLGDAERRRLVEDFAGRPAPADGDPLLLHQLFEAQAQRHPGRPAVALGEVTLGYAELDRCANQVARHLRMQGVRAEEVVGVHAGRSVELIVALLGILKAGAAYLPLDPSYPAERLSTMVEDARVQRILVHAHSDAAAAPDLGARVSVISLGERSPIWRESGDPIALEASLAQLAYMIYTSGSTGRPKGVMVSHENAVASTRARHSFYDWTLDCFLLLSSVSFDSSVAGIFWTLSQGGLLCLPDDGEHKDASLLIELIRRRGVTHLLALPSFYEQLLGELGDTRVRGVIVAGEACTPALAHRHFEALPAVALVNEYGPTEGTVWSTAWQLRAGDTGPVPIGGPIESTRAYVLDPALDLVPIGVTGELFIGGRGITRGYFARPSLTAERFVPDPHGARGERLYRTGDRVRFRPDAALEFLGRVDQQVKLRGYRIELGEIEARIRQQGEAALVAVLAREAQPGLQRLVAYVVPVDRACLNDAEAWRALEERLRLHVQASLPEFMLPAQWVVLGAFPQTPNGKLDRAALPAPALVASEAYLAPRTETEQSLASIWRQILQVERVGVLDNFFQLGGDSIVLLQVVALARQHGFQLTARDVFGHPTLAELAAFIGERGLAAKSGTSLDGEVALTPVQRWFFGESGGDADAQSQWRTFEARERLDPERVERCLRQLCERHDALRLSFEKTESGAVRQAHVPLDVLHERWTAEPLLEVAAPAESSELTQRIAAVRARLNLGQGRLLGALLAEPDGAQRLVLVVHRLVVDAASWRILVEDFDSLYRESSGRKSDLPIETRSIARWSEALLRHVEEPRLLEELARERGHWLEHSFDARAEYFPRDHEIADYSSEREAVSAVLDGEPLRALLGVVCPSQRASLEEVLLAAFTRALCRHLRKASLVVAVERQRQPHQLEGIDATRTVGWLSSHFPVRLRPELHGTQAALATLSSVKEQLRLVPRAGLGYGLSKYRAQAAGDEIEASTWPRAAFCLDDERHGAREGALLAPIDAEGAAWEPRAPGAWLSLTATLRERSLRLSFGGASAMYRPETLVELLGSVRAELDELALLAGSTPAAVSPSDFPLAGLSPLELSGLALEGVEDIYPLSPMQEGMFLHTLLEPGSGIYLMQDHYFIDSEVDPGKLTFAWQRVTERHQALRAQFIWQENGRMLQVIQQRVSVPLDLLDFRGLDPAEQREQLTALLQAERERGFDMSRAPLFQLRLIQLAEARYQLVISHHHIVLDGWSWGQVWLEVCAFYQDALDGNLEGRRAPAPAYRDFIAWLATKDPEKAQSYWRGVLSGFDEATPLPVDRSLATDEVASRIDAVRVTWSEVESAALGELATRHGLTMNTFLQAAWALTLSRYSARRDVLFGVTVAGRPTELPELQRAVGLFINTIPLRVALPQARVRVSDWLRALLDQNVEMRQHEQLPLVRVQALSAIAKSEPLFHSVLVYENVPLDSSVLPHAENLRIRTGASRVHTNYPLTVMILPGRELGLDLSFDERFFDRPSVTRLLTDFERLLRALVSHFDRPCGELPLTDGAERELLLRQGVGRQRDYPLSRGYVALFEERARRTPQRVVATCAGESLTYAELSARTARVAAGLRARGVALEGRVAVLAERGLDLLAFAIGVLKAGAIYVPLDPRHPSQRWSSTLKQGRIEVVLASAALGGALIGALTDAPEPGSSPSGARPELWTPDFSTPFQAGAASPTLYAGPSSLAYVIYTSGSTGVPKGAMVEHAGMLNNVLSKVEDLALTETDVIAQTASQAFDISVWQLLTGPMCGARLEIVPDAIAHDPLALLRHVQAAGISVLESVPSLIGAMLGEEESIAGGVPLPGLKCMITTGEAMPPELGRRWLARYPEAELINAYGPAECADDVALHRVLPGEIVRTQHLPIGRATDNNRLYVLDAELELVPFGATGELCIAGVGPGRGYLDAPAHTARAFVPNPHARLPGERLYRTGDLGRYRTDGTLEFLGRVDHQVKIRGFRVELGEIEARLLEHRTVREAAVVAKATPHGKVLVAYVVAAAGCEVRPAALKQHLALVLPEYMLPGHLSVLERLPLNDNGKLDRKALPEPESAGFDARRPYVAPRTPLEQWISEIWSDVLSVPMVGVHDDFFELGGHSLLGVQVISRVRRRTGRDVPLRALFEQSQLERFAARVAETTDRSRARVPALEPVPRTAPLPLSYAQQRLWFLWHIEPDGSAYNIPLALRFLGGLDRALLEQSFTALVARHEALRTRFASSAAGAVQVIDPPRACTVGFDDLSSLAGGEGDSALRVLAEQEALLPFDLERGPLLRVRLLRLAPGEHVLLVTMHHIISDAASLRVLVDEFAELYQAGREGRAATLEPLPVQYADYAVWQRQWLAEGELERQLRYWTELLGGEHERLDLPTDRPRPSLQSHAGASYDFELRPALCEQLQSFARSRGVSAFMLLLAGFQLLLFRYTGQRQIRVGVPNANRNQLEIERCVGFFVNTHVLATELGPELGFDGLLARVKEAALGAQAHADLPFEQLVEALNPVRSLSHPPLFEIMFNYHASDRLPLHVLSGLMLRPLERSSTTSQFDLTLDLHEGPGGSIRGSFGYATALFDRWRIEQLHRHFEQLIEQGIARPERPIAELELGARSELEPWRQASRSPAASGFRAVTDDIAVHATARPDAVALACGDERLTYAELEQRASALARELCDQGAAADSVVGVCAERSIDLFVGLLAVLKAGAAFLPLDPEAPRERNRALLADARTRLVLGRRSLLAALELGPTLRAIPLEGVRTTPHDSTPLPGLRDDQLAYVIYTSGSTGKPKGVAVEHGSLSRHCRAMGERLGLDADDRSLHFAALSFDAGVEQWLAPLMLGGQVSILAGELWSSARALDEIRAQRLTRIDLPPLYLVELARHARERGEVLGVRSCTVGGEALPSEHLPLLHQALGQAPLFNAYGPTEAVITPLVWQSDGSPSTTSWAPIGQVVGERSAYVLDAELQHLPVGVIGELYLAGLLARGYSNRPEATAERFLPNPYGRAPGERVYRTGDLARWRPDGSIEYVGRADEQVKVRGYRIELGEIQSNLLAHPAIEQALVLARRDEGGQNRLVAYVVLGASAGERFPALARDPHRELDRFLGERLPAYMAPHSYVTLERLPLLASGKVDRRALPAPARSRLLEGYAAPQTPSEVALAAIWKELLKVERVGRDDNFFALGGDSILALKVADTARRRGLSLTPKQLFQYQTVAALAAATEEEES
jgi:amino acid adenylation domain-containing protein